MKSIEAGDSARPRSCAPVNDQVVVEHTRRWISSFVIGLGLCPFARRVFDAGRIRYAISHSRDEYTLSNDLASELHLFLASPSTQIETTLLIHPHVLANFLDYNDFLDIAVDFKEPSGRPRSRTPRHTSRARRCRSRAKSRLPRSPGDQGERSRRDQSRREEVGV